MDEARINHRGQQECMRNVFGTPAEPARHKRCRQSVFYSREHSVGRVPEHSRRLSVEGWGGGHIDPVKDIVCITLRRSRLG